MKLFNDIFPEVKSDEELRLLLEKHPHYDPGYICQSAAFSLKEAKSWMEKLWTQYSPYADSNFLNDFKMQFGSRSWELYLGTTLLNRGFKLGKGNNLGPDFDLLDQSQKRISWIEATSAQKGVGVDCVSNMTYGSVSDIPKEQMLLRISNALAEKYKQYCNYINQGIVKNNEPYIIAINRSSLEHADAVIPLILKVLFGIGDLSLRFYADGERLKEPEPFWSGETHVDKKSGKKVPMLFFENSEHSGISAVIYCKDSIIDSPQVPEEMGENFIFVHNPLAINSLPKNFLPFGDEWRAIGDQVQKIRVRKNITRV